MRDPRLRPGHGAQVQTPRAFVTVSVNNVSVIWCKYDGLHVFYYCIVL